MLTFMSTTAGRWIRGVVGVLLMAGGLATGGLGWVLAAFGAVLLGTGVADVCPISPLLGRPVRGCDLRNEV